MNPTGYGRNVRMHCRDCDLTLYGPFSESDAFTFIELHTVSAVSIEALPDRSVMIDYSAPPPPCLPPQGQSS